jgi:hypothetical protein
MGYDTQIVVGDRLESPALARLLTGFHLTGETTWYDDLIASHIHPDLLGVGMGDAQMVIISPARQLNEGFLHKWARQCLHKKVIAFDLIERSDDYTLKICGPSLIRELCWIQNKAQRPRGRALPEERNLVLQGPLPQSLFDYADAFGFQENWINWKYNLYSQAGHSIKKTKKETLQWEDSPWNPAVIRLLAGC